MWTILEGLFSSSKVRKYLLAVVAVLLIFGGGMYSYNTIYNRGVAEGVLSQKQVYAVALEKSKDQLAKLQAQADTDRSTLNSQITSLKSDNSSLKTQLDQKQSTTEEMINNYEKNNTSPASQCIPAGDDGLRIINQSFPD